MARNISDLEMMQSPDLWPMWPVLPIKRWVGRALECAFLVDGQVNKLFHGSIYQLKSGMLMSEALKDIKTTDYVSFDMLIKEGWVVD